jgi:hypothetical protein
VSGLGVRIGGGDRGRGVGGHQALGRLAARVATGHGAFCRHQTQRLEGGLRWRSRSLHQAAHDVLERPDREGLLRLLRGCGEKVTASGASAKAAGQSLAAVGWYGHLECPPAPADPHAAPAQVYVAPAQTGHLPDTQAQTATEHEQQPLTPIGSHPVQRRHGGSGRGPEAAWSQR